MEAGMDKYGRSGEPSLLPQAKEDERHPIFGALKGLIWVPPGIDLTEPADPDWGKVHETNATIPARR